MANARTTSSSTRSPSSILDPRNRSSDQRSARRTVDPGDLAARSAFPAEQRRRFPGSDAGRGHRCASRLRRRRSIRATTSLSEGPAGRCRRLPRRGRFSGTVGAGLGAGSTFAGLQRVRMEALDKPPRLVVGDRQAVRATEPHRASRRPAPEPTLPAGRTRNIRAARAEGTDRPPRARPPPADLSSTSGCFGSDRIERARDHRAARFPAQRARQGRPTAANERRHRGGPRPAGSTRSANDRRNAPLAESLQTHRPSALRERLPVAKEAGL